MHMIPVSPASSTELAIAALTAAPVLAGVIIRIVLCVLAAAATRKALEDPADGKTSSDALRAHRLAVLRAILAALSIRDNAKSGEEYGRLIRHDPEKPVLPDLAQGTSEANADGLIN
jgi:predicted anti-sigma-YlaC factor YlaD